MPGRRLRRCVLRAALSALLIAFFAVSAVTALAYVAIATATAAWAPPLVARGLTMAFRRMSAGGLGRTLLFSAPIRGRNRHADQPLDVAQIPHLFVIAERDGYASCASSRSAADAVNVRVRNVGNVEIDDVADAVNVDA